MRKFFICALLILATSSSFCQQTDFRQKSKKQKTAAWILLGGGFVVAVGSVILDVSSDWTKSETPYLVGIGIGCNSMIASIPLFIAAGRNKRKAMNASTSLEIRRDPVLTSTGLSFHSTPTLSLKINF
jgi:hypothetical protein